MRLLIGGSARHDSPRREGVAYCVNLENGAGLGVFGLGLALCSYFTMLLGVAKFVYVPNVARRPRMYASLSLT